MARWEPGARERLQVAALQLYLSQGFERTTVAEVARSAGLTERTFFRHFADKREVLFDGADLLAQAFVEGVDAAGRHASPPEVITSALAASASLFPQERRGFSRRRHAVITATPALQERELLKMAALATSLTGALRARGVDEPAASLAAESGVTVFGVAFGQWIADGEQRPFPEVVRAVLGDFTAMWGAGAWSGPAPLP